MRKEMKNKNIAEANRLAEMEYQKSREEIGIPSTTNQNMYYHVLEDGGYGDIGYQGVYDTKENAESRAIELSDMFPDSSFYVEASDSEDEPTNVTSSDYDPDKDFNEGESEPVDETKMEEELNEIKKITKQLLGE
jgi:hypothetical protein